MQMQKKYQVWINDSRLIGHVYLDSSETEETATEVAIEFAIETWGDVEDDEVSVCEITESYYEDLARCSMKDSIKLGM